MRGCGEEVKEEKKKKTRRRIEKVYILTYRQIN